MFTEGSHIIDRQQAAPTNGAALDAANRAAIADVAGRAMGNLTVAQRQEVADIVNAILDQRATAHIRSAVFTVAEFAVKVNRSEDTIREWITSEKLKASRPAGTKAYIIPASELDRILATL
jgi:excisionase family DNA binding protein